MITRRSRQPCRDSRLPLTTPPQLLRHLPGCRFNHTTGPGVEVITDGCYWFESGPVRNWTVRDCTFLGVNYATAAQAGDVYLSVCVPDRVTPGPPTTTGHAPAVGQAHRGVTVVGCTFIQDQGEAAVDVTNVAGLNVTGNVVSATVAPTNGNFIATTSVDVAVGGNRCSVGGGRGAAGTHTGTAAAAAHSCSVKAD